MTEKNQKTDIDFEDSTNSWQEKLHHYHFCNKEM